MGRRTGVKPLHYHSEADGLRLSQRLFQRRTLFNPWRSLQESHSQRVGGIVADDLQHAGAEVADQLLRENRPHSLDKPSAEIPLHALAGSRRRRLEGLGFELKPVLLGVTTPNVKNRTLAI